MKTVNLIPTELAVGDATTKLARGLKSTSTVIAALSISATVIAIGVFVFFSQNLKDINAETESLKTEIQSLEASEQRLVFAKDRLAKITDIQSKENAIDEVKAFGVMYDLVNSLGDVSVSGVDIDETAFEFSIISTSLSSATAFLDGIRANSFLFSNVNLTAFSYSPGVGYSANLKFITAK